MQTHLDWSAYDSYGAGDAFAAVPVAGGALGKAAAVCIGNRQCQRDGKGVMCPSFRATRDAAHSTQHRAATLKAVLNGEYGEQAFAGPEIDAAMDLCVGCKGCKRECPNGVDMALLRSETLAQRWAILGAAPLRTRLLAAVPRLAPWLGRLRWLVWLRQQIPALARLGERWLGISARRTLPRTARRSFLQQAPRTAPIAADTREVVLLVDTFSNHFEPETAQAALEVLQAAGYAVHVARPRDGGQPLCCGRTYLSHGLVVQARAEAQRLIDALWPFVDRGLPVIGLEPSCLLMLRDEYYALVGGERIERIAKAAVLLEEFLAREHEAKRLRLVLRPLPQKHALVHGHCHQKAFGALKPMRKVLALLPELEVDVIESSCCGMAGAFGFEAEHYEMSMAMAELALLPQVRAASNDTLIVANGTSCRQQIRDGAQRESMHLARVLRAALAPQPIP